MGSTQSWVWSSLGKKFLMGLSGLALFLFVAVHLSGNLILILGTRTLYNEWTHSLESLGPLLYVIEAGLLGVFLLHIISGTSVWLDKRRARPTPYVKVANAGGPSRKTISSTSMIITGVVLLLFTIVHVRTFKYGPGIAEGYVQVINGLEVRDLYRLVIETFSREGYVIFYVAVMVFLGFHLRHGFWSAFQSLGAMNPRLTPVSYGLGVLLAIMIGLGFIVLPVWIYFSGGVA
jgi:succinate dehydrogenase / fumarate reductase cytochrome b subunit